MTSAPVPNDNAVTNDAAEILGWWKREGRCIRVTSRNGQSRTASASTVGGNESIAHLMLSESWAR